ncbi:MAG: VOC family protein [Sciscionella sp.]|nr:VOC family protein [Sciscionella sp.]
MARRMQVAVDCVDPFGLARFWTKVLGYQEEPPPTGYQSWREFSVATGARDGEPDARWIALIDPDNVGPRLLFHSVRHPKLTKNRLHLDIQVGGEPGTPIELRRPAVDAEVARLIEIGAKHLRTVEDQTDYYAVMQDPDGNEFCLC